MKTFKTYQEAKIANPESEIYTDSEIFLVTDIPYAALKVTECDPADYCMTVEKFLADGYKFVDGDVWLDYDGDVMTAECEDSIPEWRDSRRYILRAKALEQPKHTKVEYVKVEFNKLSDIVLDCENGETLYGEYVETKEKFEVDVYCAISAYRHGDPIYRKVTTELTEREVFIEDASKIMHKINGGVINDVSLGAVFDELVEGK